MRNNHEINHLFGKFRSQKFYQNTVGYGRNQASIFCIKQFIDRITKNSQLFIDGTFKVVPKFCSQLIVIMCDLNGENSVSSIFLSHQIFIFNIIFQVYPIAFIAAKSKSYQLYVKVFTYLKHVMKIDPSKIMIDYEASMRKAVRVVWENASLKGCYFHFTQAIRRRVNSIKALSYLVKSDANAFKIYKMFMKLPLLPLEKIESGLQTILKFQDDLKLSKNFKSFNNYFISTWVKKFSYSSFCVSKEKNKTNNYTESYNAKIKKYIQKNPSVYSFLGKLHILYFLSI